MTSLTDLRQVVDVVIGVDTQLATHSAAAVNAATGGVLGEITVDATAEGYVQLVQFADDHAVLRAWATKAQVGTAPAWPVTWHSAKRSSSSSTDPSEPRGATARSPTPSMRSAQHVRRWRGLGSGPREAVRIARPSLSCWRLAARRFRPPPRPSCRCSA